MASSKNSKTAVETKPVSLDDASLDSLIEDLSGSSRRHRQNAAYELLRRYAADPKGLVPHVNVLIESLNFPESRTRWNCLALLTSIAETEPALCEGALGGAEMALFDEEGAGQLRLAAVRFLCKFGGSAPERSDKVWGLLDEGIQCYHGDPEYQDMMSALLDFSVANLSEDVKAKFKERMQFDADNNRGLIQTRSQRIIDNLSK